MKHFFFLVAGVLAFSLISCQKEDQDPVNESGWLSLDIGVSLGIHDVNNVLKSVQQTDHFRVDLYRSDGALAESYSSVLEMPDTIELQAGDYYVEAHSDNDLPAAFENPYYFGTSGVFTLSGNTHQTVQVTCQLANTIVSVDYSDRVRSNFSHYQTTVSSGLGSLIYTGDESRWGYFRTAPLDILVELTYLKPDGTENSKSLQGSIPDPQPNRHYELQVDAAIQEGMGSFQIILDDTPAIVEVIPVSEDTSANIPGTVGYGDLLITEIMYDPSALSDSEGEWFEIYNNSDQPVCLQDLILGRNDVNRHTITDSIELAPSGYYVFQRTDLSTAATNSYIYGSDISLANTGAVLYLFNAGTESEPGTLIFSVNYGESGFPSGSGASISLDPGYLNAADAILGSSWCASSSLFGTGDAGTPGLANDTCQ